MKKDLTLQQFNSHAKSDLRVGLIQLSCQIGFKSGSYSSCRAALLRGAKDVHEAGRLSRRHHRSWPYRHSGKLLQYGIEIGMQPQPLLTSMVSSCFYYIYSDKWGLRSGLQHGRQGRQDGRGVPEEGRRRAP